MGINTIGLVPMLESIYEKVSEEYITDNSFNCSISLSPSIYSIYPYLRLSTHNYECSGCL